MSDTDIRYSGNFDSILYHSSLLNKFGMDVLNNDAENCRELTFEDMTCDICPISSWETCDEICQSKETLLQWLADMKLEVDRWKSRAAALENAMRTDCFYCDGVACRYSCGCINGNAWNFKEDANDKW